LNNNLFHVAGWGISQYMGWGLRLPNSDQNMVLRAFYVLEFPTGINFAKRLTIRAVKVPGFTHPSTRFKIRRVSFWISMSKHISLHWKIDVCLWRVPSIFRGNSWMAFSLRSSNWDGFSTSLWNFLEEWCPRWKSKISPLDFFAETYSEAIRYVKVKKIIRAMIIPKFLLDVSSVVCPCCASYLHKWLE